MKFTKRITAAEATIKAAGLTLTAFYDRAGIHETTWRRWRNGEMMPTLKTWERVERQLRKLEGG